MSDIEIHLKKLHQGQLNVLNNSKRFNVLKIGRRFGKTTFAINYLIPRIAISGGFVAYFTPTYNDLSDVWSEVKTRLQPIIAEKNEQTKQIKLITGGVIDFWSMDNPDSGRGRKYARVIVDEAEKAKKFKDAWQNTILPTLMDFKGDAWILSTPKFGQTYFKQLHSQRKDNWASFNLSTYDNPFIDRDEIEEIKQTMDELSFRCEILAEDVDVTNNPFAYAFDANKHIASGLFYNPSLPVLLSFDFNKDPITCIAGQSDGHTIRIIQEFALSNSDIFELCDLLLATFHNVPLMITGDATGRNRSALTKGNYNYYTVIKQKLMLGDNQMKVGNINPSVADTRVLMNSLLQKADIKINDTCTRLIKDLKYVEVDNEGDIKKDRSSEFKMSDFLDCFRYYCFAFHHQFIKIYA